MHFEKDFIYHVFNRSNEKTFFTDENYLFFLRKVNVLIKPCCEILCWCLMPNHFHFLIKATDKTVENINEKHREATQLLSKNIGTLISSYSQAINKQQNRKGSLWSHNTEAVCIEDGSDNYGITCFHYIHQNPIEAKLTEKCEDWEFSSYRDFVGMRNGKLANKKLAIELFNLTKKEIEAQSVKTLDEDIIKKFYK